MKEDENSPKPIGTVATIYDKIMCNCEKNVKIQTAAAADTLGPKKNNLVGGFDSFQEYAHHFKQSSLCMAEHHQIFWNHQPPNTNAATTGRWMAPSG